MSNDYSTPCFVAVEAVFKGKRYFLRQCIHDCGCMFCSCKQFAETGHCDHIRGFNRMREEDQQLMIEMEKANATES